jgi:hypothetical protein
MLKHKGFPSRLPSTDFQFTIRRANKDGATKLIARERYADRRPADRRADAGFVEALWLYFGEDAVRAWQSRRGAAQLALRARGDPRRGPVRSRKLRGAPACWTSRARAAFPEAFDGSGIWEGRAP